MYDLYTILIIYFVFLVYQKSLALFMENKFPTYEDIQKTTPFWQNVYKLRSNGVISDYVTVIISRIYDYTT